VLCVPINIEALHDCRGKTAGFPCERVSIDEFKLLIEGEQTYLAKEDTEPMAFISIWEPEKFIHHLYVAPQHQGQGLGHCLIAHADKRFGRPLYLKCGEANTAVRSFYDRTGWVALSREIGPDGPYINYVPKGHA